MRLIPTKSRIKSFMRVYGVSRKKAKEMIDKWNKENN